jgi:hypothetical protein
MRVVESIMQGRGNPESPRKRLVHSCRLWLYQIFKEAVVGSALQGRVGGVLASYEKVNVHLYGKY